MYPASSDGCPIWDGNSLGPTYQHMSPCLIYYPRIMVVREGPRLEVVLSGVGAAVSGVMFCDRVRIGYGLGGDVRIELGYEVKGKLGRM